MPKKKFLILLSALLISFSFASSPFSFFIYFALIPFIRRIEISKSHNEAFKIGYIVGLIVNIFVTYWLIYYKFSSYLLIIILNPFQYALFAYLYSHLKIFSFKTRIIIFPFLWTFLEYIREFGDLSLNWLNIGYTQGNFVNLIQFADTTGLNGIVFWICLINVVIYITMYKDFHKRNILINYIVIFSLFLLPFFYGQNKISEPKIRNGIMTSYIQPNINSVFKWDKGHLNKNINTLIEESTKLEVDPNSLIVWPETSISNSILKPSKNRDRIYQFIRDRSAYILSGMLYNNNELSSNLRYNSSVLFSFDDPEVHKYNKIKLVPVAEILPYSQFYDFLFSNSFLSNYYVNGATKTVFSANLQLYKTKYTDLHWKLIENTDKINTIKFSTNICFESSFPSFVREFILNGVEFIVVQTNDEWFKYSSQPVQHLITSKFRAIENRISVIHCSNAGVSSFIDPYGRFYGTSKLLEKSSNTQIITLRNELSFFSKYGDLTGKLSTIFILMTFIVIFYKRSLSKTK